MRLAVDLLIDRLLPAGEPRDLVRRIHGRISDTGQVVPLRMWNGETLGPEKADYRIVLNAPWSMRALLIPGTDLAVGEAFLDDAFDVEGSMVAAIRQVARMDADQPGLLQRLGIAADVLRLPRPPRAHGRERARLRGKVHTQQRDREAVRWHYDVGNEFYALFLDERLVYSCGYFSPEHDGDPGTVPDDALELAQLRKLDLVCRKLRLRAGQRLLDVGCGWGALVIHAAERHGVEAVGITLSDEQADLARKRVADRGLTDRVEIRVQDYRETTGTFDAVASVGMVEHVGVQRLDDYFRQLHDLTRPGGWLLNHGITTGGRDQVRDFSTEIDSFAARYVFPDGALVPSATMVAHAERAGFEVVDLEQLRPHYARTLQHWVHRLERAADRAVELGGQRTYRTWRAYMSGSVVGFESNDLGVIQLLCSRDAQQPFGRAWMLPAVNS